MSKCVAALLVCMVLLGAVQGFAKDKSAEDGTTIITQQVVLDAGGFPFKIIQSGNYKLGGNLVVPANASGILVQANDVTVDLNGFSITGGIACDNDGVTCSGAPSPETKGVEAILGFVNGQTSNIRGVVIKNGHVRGFTFGIDTFGGIVEEITAQGNLSAGIRAAEAVVRRNEASRNHVDGIDAINCTVRDNMAALNRQGNQFTLVFGGVFAGNTAVTPNHAGLGALIDVSVISDNNNSCNSIRC